MDIRRYVLDAIGDDADGQGSDLSELIQFIDFYQRFIPTHAELLSAIASAIRDGEIIEVGHLRYSKPKNGLTAADFSGLSESEFDRALNEFSGRVSAELARIERSGEA